MSPLLHRFSSYKDSITISTFAWQQMNKHMLAHPDEEVCGILLGEPMSTCLHIHTYRQLHNAAADRVHSFSLDPQEWIHCCYHEPEMIGLFHSHPYSAPVPSLTDRQQLPQFASMLSVYLIGSASHCLGANENNRADADSSLLQWITGSSVCAYHIEQIDAAYTLRPVKLMIQT